MCKKHQGDKLRVYVILSIYIHIQNTHELHFKDAKLFVLSSVNIYLTKLATALNPILYTCIVAENSVCIPCKSVLFQQMELLSQISRLQKS